MQTVIDGVLYDCDDSGYGTPIVLVHGLPLGRTMWNEQMAVLVAKCRVIRYDLPGCGESGPVSQPMSIDDLARHLAGLLDALDLERAVVVGHSLGGYVALAFLHLFPQRVAGFGLIASHAGGDAPETRALWNEQADSAERDGIDAVVDSLLPLYFSPNVYSGRRDIVRRTRDLMERCDARSLAILIRAMQARDSSETLLAELEVPALIVAGANDDWESVDALRATSASIRNARFELLEDCGHMPTMEKPERVARALGELVDRARA